MSNEPTRASEVKEDILRSLRRITRAIDLHSRHLAHTFGLTGPQLVCLRTVGARGKMTPSELAKQVSLSQATITGIIDRLAARQLHQILGGRLIPHLAVNEVVDRPASM